ncbi:hypothetical protein ACLOJK_011064 [Asimina triloba]
MNGVDFIIIDQDDFHPVRPNTRPVSYVCCLDMPGKFAGPTVARAQGQKCFDGARLSLAAGAHGNLLAVPFRHFACRDGHLRLTTKLELFYTLVWNVSATLELTNKAPVESLDTN